MKSLPPSAPAIRRTCSRNPPDENPQQLDAGRRGDAGARHGPRRDEAGRHPVSRQRSRRDVFARPAFRRSAIIAGSRAIAQFAGRRSTCRSIARWPRTSSTSWSSRRTSTWRTRKTPSSATRSPCRSSIVIGKRDIPVIPFFTNVYVPPLPTPQRCAALGKALADIVKGRKERVAIIASGGMSHFPGTTQVPASRSSISIAGWCRSSRRATPTRCST